jgi:hypothetical protein
LTLLASSRKNWQRQRHRNKTSDFLRFNEAYGSKEENSELILDYIGKEESGS